MLAIHRFYARHIAPALLVAALSLLSGCATISSFLGLNYSSQQRTVSSAVEYLYPNQRGTVNIKTRIPQLVVPLNVGIAFVPDSCDSFRRHDLNEELKRELMDRVVKRFEERDIINKVVAIPSHMMKRKGSFTNLRQIRKELGIDIVVLLSYDQVQYTERNFISAAYNWTVVGRYVFQGDENDTVTMMDAAVYDIPSEELLFRSQGSSNVQGAAASAFVAEELRERSQQGFGLAIDDLIKNLDWDLYQFKQKVKKDEVKVTIVHRSGSGGGSMNGVGLLILMAGLVLLRARTTTPRR